MGPNRRFSLDSENLARRIADLTAERKAHDIVVLDIRRSSSYADFLVIASGTSDRHVQSVAELVSMTLKKDEGAIPIGVEGLREGQWALIDFGDVILHVFHQFTREVYALEELWSDAPRLHLTQQAAGAGT